MDYPVLNKAPEVAVAVVPHYLDASGKAVPQSGGDSSANITTNTTTAVKAGAGALVRIVINTKGAAANVATIYDNTAASGTKIGILDTVNGTIGSIEYGCAFATGLTI